MLFLILLPSVGQANSLYHDHWENICQNQQQYIQNRGNFTGKFEVGVALANIGKIEEAIALFQQIPDDQDNARKIINNYQKLLADNPNDIFLLNFTAFGFFVLDKYKESADYFERALKIDGKNIWLMNFYALALAYQKDFKNAHQLIDQSLSIKEDDYTYIFQGIILYEEGKRWQALMSALRNPEKTFSLMKYFK